jgi:predicted nuclease of restriction endonuclease-like (RecB) superfamily
MVTKKKKKNELEIKTDISEDLKSNLLFDVQNLIDSAQSVVARYTNSTLVVLNWKIGNRINTEILSENRAEYGEMIIKNLSKSLINMYGKGFDARALFRMVKFSKLFPDEAIVATLSPLLSWSKFIELIAIEDPIKRKFYTEMCRLENWSVRDLRKKIDGMMFERTAISKKPENVIKQELEKLNKSDKITPDLVFRDPYILNFLKLPDMFSESDFESAILDELCLFLQELGGDFSFIARQKRITIDGEDFYIDLLMFHRGLRRLIAIELKLGKFKASYKGQVELYLRWLDKHERKSGEEHPLGLILCAEKRQEHIELLELDKSGIHVAQYLTELPPREILEEKLKKAIKVARERYNSEKIDSDD